MSIISKVPLNISKYCNSSVKIAKMLEINIAVFDFFSMYVRKADKEYAHNISSPQYLIIINKTLLVE